MMGRLNHDQEQLLYSFHLDEAVPHDHPVRQIAAVLDLSWVHCDLAPFYPKMGRPSIDPELMIRMLIIGYLFAIRSERALCRDVQVNLAYRWFCGLSIEDKIPDHSAFSRARHGASVTIKSRCAIKKTADRDNQSAVGPARKGRYSTLGIRGLAPRAPRGAIPVPRP